MSDKNTEIVKCMDCDTQHDLFYDLEVVVEEMSDGEEIEGVDLGDCRDPVRCVLCRRFPRLSENEKIQCEECEDSNCIFVWVGKYNDAIICKTCYDEEKEN